MENILDLIDSNVFEYVMPTMAIASKKYVMFRFCRGVVPDIQGDSCVPNINFAFSEEDIRKISEFIGRDVSCLCNQEGLVIDIKDSELFFDLLTDVVNAQIGLDYDYDIYTSEMRVTGSFLKHLWLRMGIDDIEDINMFLKKQLDFLTDRSFDKPKEISYFKTFEDNDVFYEVEKTEEWCESSRRICFTINSTTGVHDLPKIYYDIREEDGKKVCYISAVQMGSERHRDKNIERKLYKLNKGFDEVLVHPNFVMSMSLFYEFLSNNNITHIKVPALQVLSYDYHLNLDISIQESYKRDYPEEKLVEIEEARKNLSIYENRRLVETYEYINKQYERFVGTTDRTSKSKTEGLVNLFMHMAELDKDSEINTLPLVESPYLEISLKNEKKYCLGTRK